MYAGVSSYRRSNGSWSSSLALPNPGIQLSCKPSNAVGCVLDLNHELDVVEVPT